MIVGDGPQRDAISALVADKELSPHVTVKPFAQYNVLPAYYGLARAAFTPSAFDQWGLVVNEAMAAGTPVFVSQRCGCAEDLVKHGVNGGLFDPTNTDAIADAFLGASDAAACARMGRAAQDTIAHWSPERFADGYLEAASHALSAPRRRRVGGLVHAGLLRGLATMQSFQAAS